MTSRDMLPFVSTVFRLIRSGVEHYATLADLNPQMRHGAVAAFLRVKIEDWNPEISGVSILNAAARDDLASFSAHVSLALGKVANKGAA